MDSLTPKNLYIDFDGCLGTINTFYTREGKVMKSVSASDSLVIDLLRKEGVIDKVIVITGDSTGFDITKARVADLGYELVYCKNKEKFNYIKEREKNFSDIIYIGDDIYDVVIFEKVKFSGTPSKIPFVRERAEYITACEGGKGAVSDLLIQMATDILWPDLTFEELVYNNVSK